MSRGNIVVRVPKSSESQCLSERVTNDLNGILGPFPEKKAIEFRMEQCDIFRVPV